MLGLRRSPSSIAYEVREVADVSVRRDGNSRVRVRVVVPDAGDSLTERLAALTMVLRDLAQTHRSAQALFLFAYIPDTPLDGAASLGRAVWSRDGLGWDQSGRLLTQPAPRPGAAEVAVVTRYDAMVGVSLAESVHLVDAP